MAPRYRPSRTCRRRSRRPTRMRPRRRGFGSWTLAVGRADQQRDFTGMRDQSMAPLKDSRRLTLLDLMIAIAGLTVGFWIMPYGPISAAEEAFPTITGPYVFTAKVQWLS